MGMKWTARLRVDFEMEEWAAPDLAETRLKTSVGEFQHQPRDRIDRCRENRHQTWLGQG